MAEPTFVGSGAYLDGSAANAAVAVPSGASAGRVVVIALFMDGNVLTVHPTMPSGFSLAEGAPVPLPNGSGSHTLYVWWKRLTGSDTGTYTFSWSGARYREAQAHLYDNVVSTGTPFDSPTSTASDVGDLSVTPAVNVTSLGPDRRLIWAATNWTGGTWTPPSGHTLRMVGGAEIIALSDRSWPTAGATGSVTGSCSGSDKRNVWFGALIGTTTSGATGTMAATLPALGAQAEATATASAVASAALPSLGSALAGAVTATGTAAAALPPIGSTLAGTAAADAVSDATLPPLGATFAGNATASGDASAALPALGAALGAAATATADVEASLPSLTAEATGQLATSGALPTQLPALQGGIAGTATVEATVAATLPALTANFAQAVIPGQGSFAAALPPLAAGLDVTVSTSGSAAATLPALQPVTMTGSGTAEGALSGSLPALSAALAGQGSLQPSGSLAAALPALAAALTGTSEAVEVIPGVMSVRDRAGSMAERRTRPGPQIAVRPRTGATAGGNT